MSRIHEALKKAAEERSAQSANRATADLVDLSIREELARKLPVLGDARPNTRTDEKPDAGLAHFEEFAKRCTQAVWKIDPTAHVYSAHGNTTIGAEKFRTLRSQLYQIASAQPLKRILITSSTPAEGKTFVTANLAQSFIRQETAAFCLLTRTYGLRVCTFT